MNLKNISTKEIVKELESRTGVQMFQNKLYQEGYNVNIVKKYSKDRTPIQLSTDITVLVIEDSLLSIEDKVEENMEVIWRRFEIINKGNEDKLSKLIKSKNLSREDLELILKTIKLREFN